MTNNIRPINSHNEVFQGYRDRTQGLPFRQKVEQEGLTAALAGRATKRNEKGLLPLIFVSALLEGTYYVGEGVAKTIGVTTVSNGREPFEGVARVSDFVNMALNSSEARGELAIASVTVVEPAIVDATIV